MTGTALFVGDVSVDLTLPVARVPEPDEKVHVSELVEACGGVIANAAIACLSAGAPARALFRLGDDEAGGRAAAQLQRRGLDCTIETVAGATCRCVILVESHGEKRLLLYPGVSMYPGLPAIDALDLGATAWVHTAVHNEAVAARLIQRCRTAGIPFSIDLEPATFPAGIDRLEPMLEGAAVVFCNRKAAVRIGEDAAQRLSALGCEAVVLSAGAQGAAWWTLTGATEIAAPRIPVVDTTGAGDCLAGWFIAERLRGCDPIGALERAILAASDSCRRLGGQQSYPGRGNPALASKERVTSP